jgi:hypothetical protein
MAIALCLKLIATVLSFKSLTAPNDEARPSLNHPADWVRCNEYPGRWPEAHAVGRKRAGSSPRASYSASTRR